jgi:hypothetical protein
MQTRSALDIRRHWTQFLDDVERHGHTIAITYRHKPAMQALPPAIYRAYAEALDDRRGEPQNIATPERKGTTTPSVTLDDVTAPAIRVDSQTARSSWREVQLYAMDKGHVHITRWKKTALVLVPSEWGERGAQAATS